ncbi:MAG: diacylglycerol/polyprenol kinase family protein [Chloroflexota bacterium]
MNNYIALVITFLVAVAFLRLMDFIAQRGWIESRMSRKLIHIGTGPIFVLCWLMFSDVQNGRWLAALVPLLITAQFVLVGTGVIKDEAAVKAMSRTGDRREILRGPLFYGIAFVALTLIYWKDSLIGIPALMIMCGGDGIADIVGRRVNSPRLPWSLEKSLLGSISVFVGGWLLTMFIFAVYVWMGTFSGPITRFLLPVTGVALGATLVESLPFRDVDNLTVTIAAALLGHLLF